MLSLILPSLLILISLGVIVWLVVRKYPQLTLLDVDRIPSVQEKQKKNRILQQRADKLAEKKRSEWSSRLRPIVDMFMRAQQAFRSYVARVQQQVMRHTREQEETLSDSEKARRVQQALNDAKHAVHEEAWETAEKLYIAAIRMDQKNVEAYRGLADVYFAQEQYLQAEETYQFVLQLASNDDSVWMKLAEVAEARGDIETAIDRYQQALLINDNLANRFAKLTDLFLQVDRPDTALEAIQQALYLEPQNPKYLDKFVETSIMVGDKSLAEDALYQLRMVNPDNKKLDVFRDRIRKLGNKKA